MEVQIKLMYISGMETKQISATVKVSTVEVVDDIAKKEERTFSAMVDILLAEAAARRIMKLPKPASKISKTNKSK